MQTNKQQTTSFPYLSQDVTNYKTTVFDLSVKKGFNEKQVRFDVEYDINNQEIKQLIIDKKLSVVVSLFCQPVGLNLSKKLPFDAKNTSFVLDIMAIEKAVEFSAHLIVEESFLYSNSDLTKDWAGEEYWVEKYNDIGTSVKVKIPFEHKKEGKRSSIFQFQELASLDTLSPVTYRLDGDVIYFIVPKQVLNNYRKVQGRKPEAILSAFIIPALTDILRQMHNPSEDELNDFNNMYEGKRWYQVITEKYEKIIGKDPMDCEVDPFKAAQLLVKSPIHNLLAYVKTAINRMEGEDQYA